MNKNLVKLTAGIFVPVLAIGIILWANRNTGGREQELGQKSYKKYCSNCHGEDGKGLRQLIPPLTDARYLALNDLVCTIRYGKSGPITVNGQEYDRRMPTNYEIEGDEITAVINYIYNEINHLDKKVTLPEINAHLESCQDSILNY